MKLIPTGARCQYTGADGLLWLKVSNEKGSTDQVPPIPIDSPIQGEERRIDAKRVRDAGGRVEEAWAEWIDAQRLKRSAATGTATPHVQSRHRLHDVAADWLTKRRRIMEASNHAISGLRRDNSNLRPTTLDLDESIVESALLVDGLDQRWTVDLDVDAVEGWITALAEEGVGPQTQALYLKKLRHIVKRLPRSQQPDSFPWHEVGWITPAEPVTPADDPTKWGGKPGQKPPAVLFHHMAEIARAMRACGRVVIYLIAIMGLRRGEAMGLTLRHLVYRDTGEAEPRLFMLIRQQRHLSTGRLLLWVKADASNRDLPVPRQFEEYLVRYVARYFDGYDLKAPPIDPNDPRRDRFLCVTSTGRDVDASFMSAHPGTWLNWYYAALAATGHTREKLGYALDPHHHRRSLSSYLLRADALLVEIGRRTAPPAPTEGCPAEERVVWLTHEVELLKARESAVVFSGAGVSAWIGQKWEGAEDDEPAGGIAFEWYNRNVGLLESAGFTDIANFLDTIIEFEIPEGILDEPDEHDTALVLSIDDTDWLLLDEAAAELGVAEQTPGLLARRGRVRSEVVYFADGDREPPGLRRVLWAEDVRRLSGRKRDGIAFYKAAEVMHLDRSTLRRLVDDPRSPLQLHSTEGAKLPHLLRSEAIAVLGAVHRGVVEALGSATMSTKVLRNAMVAHVAGHTHLAIVFPNAPKLTVTPLRAWVDHLVAAGALRRIGNGHIQVADANAVEGAAALVFDAVESFNVGPKADPAKAAKLARKSARPRGNRPGGTANLRDETGRLKSPGSDGRKRRRPTAPAAAASDTAIQHSAA